MVVHCSCLTGLYVENPTLARGAKKKNTLLSAYENRRQTNDSSCIAQEALRRVIFCSRKTAVANVRQFTRLIFTYSFVLSSDFVQIQKRATTYTCRNIIIDRVRISTRLTATLHNYQRRINRFSITTATKVFFYFLIFFHNINKNQYVRVDDFFLFSVIGLGLLFIIIG